MKKESIDSESQTRGRDLPGGRKKSKNNDSY